MITALCVGLVVGFVLAIPPGPITIACLRQALAGQTREGVALALAASAMDIVYALLAALASSALVGALRDIVTGNAWYLLAFQGGCIVVLVVLGLHYWRPTTPAGAGPHGPEEPERPRGDASPYLRGVLIALTNLASPTFLPTLIFTMSLLHARGWVGHDISAHLLYALGFGAGGALWFLLLLRTLTRLRAQVSPTVMPMLSRIAGGLLLLFALLLTYQVVTTTAWARLPGWSAAPTKCEGACAPHATQRWVALDGPECAVVVRSKNPEAPGWRGTMTSH
jgi:threonine/homoserine/homoserine lactone efflux protein